MKNILLTIVLYYLFIFPIQATDTIQSFIANCTHSNNLVFDVGAHHGKKTDLYLQNGCSVICFEPQPECASLLKKKFFNNPNVTIEEVGLSSQPGQLDMYICSKATTISTFSSKWINNSRFSKLGYTWDKKIRVPIQTLDIMIKKYGLPQFCKIDVENHELEVLQGLTQPIPFISFEVAIETFDTTRACLDYLEKLGYQKFNCAFGEKPEFLFTTWLNKESFMSTLQEYINSSICTEPHNFWGDIYAAFNLHFLKTET